MMEELGFWRCVLAAVVISVAVVGHVALDRNTADGGCGAVDAEAEQ